MDENKLEFLGKDKHGFSYYLDEKDNYVYQKYTNRDYFFHGENMKNKFNGWFCSFVAWKRRLHKLLV